ncbi:hypothetical protein HBI56_062060 [Parastagonospora nodorum]|uniref:Uncharacterized protein n=2 Tax=Phaeosphaeria nodorum (strain SN15 / ATCC MYA-4574 / FGSC 10173) TaxID=321614 RepID=Q0UHS9_PHANO|nr:hypothetical protein SNOG_08685 [Parastagonospora nodorum SN15]KAH3909432.1 hypothetical protein HBH56_156490 [Parastagonospora nodorum]EAT83853.1 hypothetical protein SNOG_08685 [Parastagonospora nodorum SN15]KAH3922950.1 hypothetical protein HBH54_218230 [Parastagonospora nodorum]KAH3946871.1 hypothetical protein HBH53_125380 [Parastagonospora nodorum]KAH3969626.1 hypothetical protein HBH52_173380 [Parastagonospora nodorum]
MSNNITDAVRSATLVALGATSGFTPGFEAYLDSFDIPQDPTVQPETTPPPTKHTKPSTAITAPPGQLTPAQQWINANIHRFRIVEMEPYGDVPNAKRGVYVEFDDEENPHEPKISSVLRGAKGIDIIHCEPQRGDENYVNLIMAVEKFDRKAGCSVNVKKRVEHVRRKKAT